MLVEEYFDNQAHKWIIKEILNIMINIILHLQWMYIKVELQKIENEVLQSYL
jgi:hypothetical protein